MKQLSLFSENTELISTPERPLNCPIVISYGGGVNSTALLVYAKRANIKIDAIVFADTGDEHPVTYGWLEKIDRWLEVNDMPKLTIVRYQMKEITQRRRKRVAAKVSRNWKSLELAAIEAAMVAFQDSRQFIRYHSLGENCLINEVLPSKAFGKGGCSAKWKIEPIFKYYSENYSDLTEWVGIHFGEKQRLLMGDGTPKPRYQKSKDTNIWIDYPLVENGLDQRACQILCLSEFKEIPHKSSCWFCPSKPISEVRELKKSNPDLFELGCYLETEAVKHFTEGGTKGLGRSFAWNDIDKLTPLEIAAIEAEKAGRQCHCTD